MTRATQTTPLKPVKARTVDGDPTKKEEPDRYFRIGEDLPDPLLGDSVHLGLECLK